MRSKERFVLIIPFLLLSFACNFFGDTAEDYTLPVNPELSDIRWETYKDTEYGFSIDYPSNWFYYHSSKPYDDISQGSFVLFSSTLGNTTNQSRTEDEEARLIVNILPNDTNMGVESWLAESPLLQSEVSRLSTNGNDSIRIITTPDNQDDNSTYIYLFVATSSLKFSLVGVISPSDNSSLWHEVIINMQDSFNPSP